MGANWKLSVLKLQYDKIGNNRVESILD